MASVFSKIIAGEIEGSFVYQDDLVVAFLDVAPITPGHTLVVPRREILSFRDFDEATGSRMYRVAGLVAKALCAGDIRCEGITLLMSDGEAAGQEVPHAHLHIIPRYTGDGFRWEIPESRRIPTRNELDTVAAKIRLRID
jgi:histidine triad (HIT) family protein